MTVRPDTPDGLKPKDLLGIPWRFVAGSGIAALLEGTEPGRTVLLRADMDALPVEEEGNDPWRSKYPGRMHACGHDVHTACLLGAARLLADRKNDFSGNVLFVFQPAEETSGGPFP
jgi:metal-dependent amidase/aminoacylase/carboxypeptidase family protein